MTRTVDKAMNMFQGSMMATTRITVNIPMLKLIETQNMMYDPQDMSENHDRNDETTVPEVNHGITAPTITITALTVALTDMIMIAMTQALSDDIVKNMILMNHVLNDVAISVIIKSPARIVMTMIAMNLALNDMAKIIILTNHALNDVAKSVIVKSLARVVAAMTATAIDPNEEEILSINEAIPALGTDVNAINHLNLRSVYIYIYIYY
jgi:hypothetical protein